MSNFISVYDSMPALNMLCDIKLKSGHVKKTRLVSESSQSPYLVWVGQENYDKKEDGATGINPPNFISSWRYNEDASVDEAKSWFKTINKVETL